MDYGRDFLRNSPKMWPIFISGVHFGAWCLCGTIEPEKTPSPPSRVWKAAGAILGIKILTIINQIALDDLVYYRKEDKIQSWFHATDFRL